MSTKIGLWIDHREATIVSVTDAGELMQTVVSGVESQPRRDPSSGSGSYESLQVSADDRRQRALTGHMATYYDRVIDCIRDADKIFIFGPGEAKGELRKRLEKNSPATQIESLETADRMTKPQIAAKVRMHFVGVSGGV